MPASPDMHGVWGVAPNKVAGAVAPVFSPFPKGEGGYNNPSGASNFNLTYTKCVKPPFTRLRQFRILQKGAVGGDEQAEGLWHPLGYVL